ncbi:MAG: hypothetical protein JSU01_00445 [Bacteroidetes bacterium]|nr:hypothetical protein [Bacteroidota bacterium]
MIPKQLFLVLVTVLAVSCTKFADDDIGRTAVKKTTKPQDTIPDGAFFKLRLQRDSVSIDETLLQFDHAASCDFNPGLDAAYFAGFGAASLSSLTDDNRTCSIQTLPYRQNEPVRLDVESRSSDHYIVKISARKNIPAYTRVWLKDTRLGDSTDLRSANYAFSVSKADACSFGSKRFVVIVR